MRRILIFGNSGSGKSTLARQLAQEHHLPHLDLDHLAWTSPGIRKPTAESASEIAIYTTTNPEWIAEGCYGDLLELMLQKATEVVFLNPGVEACVANCRARPWEPEKYPSKEDQDERLEFLIQWVREYETRTDEYSFHRHRMLFDGFQGAKQELR